MKKLIIATRKSPLALWQAEHIKLLLLNHYPDLTLQLLPLSTEGDRLLETSLAKIGGKGLFTKTLEHALLSGKADIAVHSMKDVPHQLPSGLEMTVVGERASPYDAFVSEQYHAIAQLPEGAIVGTSSLRRQCQFLALRPDCRTKLLRGNVNTRLNKLKQGEYDAILLAEAGLVRLGFGHEIKQTLSPDIMLPGGGQGALGVEYGADNKNIINLLIPLIHKPTQQALIAERAMTAMLNGSCQVPIGAYAQIKGQLSLRGLVACPRSNRLLLAERYGDDPVALGKLVASELLAQGADEILAKLGRLS